MINGYTELIRVLYFYFPVTPWKTAHGHANVDGTSRGCGTDRGADDLTRNRDRVPGAGAWAWAATILLTETESRQEGSEPCDRTNWHRGPEREVAAGQINRESRAYKNNKSREQQKQPTEG